MNDLSDTEFWDLTDGSEGATVELIALFETKKKLKTARARCKLERAVAEIVQRHAAEAYTVMRAKLIRSVVKPSRN